MHFCSLLNSRSKASLLHLNSFKPGGKPGGLRCHAVASSAMHKGSWPPPGWSTCHDLHVMWDLDNKRPTDSADIAPLLTRLKKELRRGGTINSINAFANRATCTEFEPQELISVLEESAGADAHRCSFCGKRCKSSDELQKHFIQLHEREHNKRIGAKSGKGIPEMRRAKNYMASDKADRYLEAVASIGGGYKSRRRLGKSGTALKALLHQQGIKLIDVPVKDQAADHALSAFARKVLRSFPPKLKTNKGAMDTATTAAEHVEAAHEKAGQIESSPSSQPKEATFCLISDDFGFVPLMQEARERGWSIVMVTSREYHEGKFAPYADAFIAWEDVYEKTPAISRSKVTAPSEDQPGKRCPTVLTPMNVSSEGRIESTATSRPNTRRLFPVASPTPIPSDELKEA